MWGMLHDDPGVFHFVGSGIISSTINSTYCCLSVKTFSIIVILLTEKCVRERYKGNSPLRFYGNDGYANTSSCYLTPTLPILFLQAYTIDIANY